MKVYQIELQRTSYTMVVVSADNKKEAEALAWQMVQNGTDVQDTEWECTEVEEIGGTA